MNHYEQKQEAKRERLLAAADRAEAQSEAAYKRADMREEVSGIPFGQPVLVGHHSEGRHRAALKRADNAMRACIEADKRAKELRGRAESVGKGGISSDDPDAINKLRAELAEKAAQQESMKARNAAWRKEGNKAGRQADGTWVDAPFAAFQLSNNSANMARIKARIAQLEKANQAETKRHSFQDVCELIENVEENRLQFIFDGKPDEETRKSLKGHGFRWAPSQGAWQRQLTNSARYSAKLVLRELGITA